MLVWAVWCYPDTCLELLKVIWSWAVFPDVREVARIDRPETAPLLVHEGQRKLRGEKVTVPDSIVTMLHMGRNYHLYWMEVCVTQTLNNFF